ncbi:agmatinase [Halovivax asiaticus JCM 14624]|uniref:Agmatinase n=1 Tax=Halovivax asiaticus JCM 14624 TaxID=1227490 RepID=M0BCZ2_9EURY|nr:agmatinase [Halovivax asiaticus]ELZ08347.1 agmatinase [Halovivax asiaticus JCM 14624]
MFPGATDRRDASDANGHANSSTDDDPAASEDANFVIVGAPLDASTTFEPGTRFGPRHVRHFAAPFDDYDHRTDQHFSDLDVVDDGDVHAWDDVAAYLEYLEGTLRDVTWDEAVPLAIGGEHTISLAGARATEPDVFVCLDAHLDLRDEYDGNRLNHACVTRRILEADDLEVEEAIILGARTGSEDEWERAAADDVTVVPPASVGEWIAETDVDAVLDGRETYLSVDIDGADPAYAPGTGTMEPFGLEPREMRDAVRTVAPFATGFDVVEVNDRDDGQAASLAGKLLKEFVYTHAASGGPVASTR